MEGRIVQINVKPEGKVGLPKERIEETEIKFDGVEGDFNHYRFYHKENTPNQAVLLIPIETIEELNNEGWTVKPGDLGENITTEGIEFNAFKEGMRIRMGGAIIELTKQATPCKNLSVLPYVSDVNEFIETMKGRRGWYAKVLKEGKVKTGDHFIVEM